VLCSALAAAVPSNSKLEQLTIHGTPLLPFMLIGKQYYPQDPLVRIFGSIDDSLCTAIKNGLGMNETIEELFFNDICLCDDTIALWCKAFSFIRTNKALKYLMVTFDQKATESAVAALFRTDIAAMLQENTSL
jgi:hypothetical protein